jgi:hypothetical protein
MRAAGAAPSFFVNKLGNWVNPLDVVDGGAKSLQGFAPDGPSLEYAESFAAGKKARTLTLTSLDAGVVRSPDMTQRTLLLASDTSSSLHCGLQVRTSLLMTNEWHGLVELCRCASIRRTRRPRRSLGSRTWPMGSTSHCT